MTAKDYELIADTIAKLPAKTTRFMVIVEFVKALAASDKEFDTDKFLERFIPENK